MITIHDATPADFETIKNLAYSIWPDTYGAILSKTQLDYMLAKFYSAEMLNENYNSKNHRFLLAKEGNQNLGFASYEHNYNLKQVTRIHKIYVLPQTQGKGIGKILMDKIEDLAKSNDSQRLSLNVNRSNNALIFYQKVGFAIVGEEDIELEHGYLMEDYIMEKPLSIH